MGNSHLISSTSALIPLLFSLMTTEDNSELLKKPAAVAIQKDVPRNQMQSFIEYFFCTVYILTVNQGRLI